MDPAARPRLRVHLRTEPLDRRVLVYDPNGGMVVELNDTAGLVLQLCDGERTAGEIVSTLAEAYPDAAGKVSADVTRILDDLVEGEVLEWG